METEQKRAEAKSKYHLFGGFYCEELEAVFGGGLPERNTAGNVGVLFICMY